MWTATSLVPAGSMQTFGAKARRHAFAAFSTSESTTTALAVPKNITMIHLPSRAPELNPVENVWQHLRANWHSNRVFETYDDIVDAACDAWRKLIAQPATITSIGHREWASVGQK